MPPGSSPASTTRLRLNSRRELLFKINGQWVNVTPDGGLNDSVSQLHLLTGCYNSYDDHGDRSFEEVETQGTYIKVNTTF